MTTKAIISFSLINNNTSLTVYIVAPAVGFMSMAFCILNKFLIWHLFKYLIWTILYYHLKTALKEVKNAMFFLPQLAVRPLPIGFLSEVSKPHRAPFSLKRTLFQIAEGRGDYGGISL